jgi:xyloglucan-specific exo-beta-1,4-glucanase
MNYNAPMVHLRACVALGFALAFSVAFGKGIVSRVHISFATAQEGELKQRLRPFVTGLSVGNGQALALVKEQVPLARVQAEIESVEGAIYRFSEPYLDYAVLANEGDLDWPKLRKAFKARYQSYLDLLSPQQRRRAESKAPGLGWIEARYYWLKKRGAIKLSPEELALRQKVAIEQAQDLPEEDGLAGWTEFGPGSIVPPPGNSGFGPYPVTGRVNAVVYDPLTTTTIYAGTAGGGVWKSTDSGISWTPLSDQWKSLNISSLAVHPTNPNIIYAGTGDFNGWIFSSAGIYKSVNGGATWFQLTPTANWHSVNDIIIDPDNPNIVLAATGPHSGLIGETYRSTDGGSTWTLVSNCYALTRTNNLFSGSVYVGSNHTQVVRRSTDQGFTWGSSTLPSPFSNGGSDIAASKVDIRRIFLVLAGAERVYESNDWGQTWTDISGNLGQAGVWTQASSYNLHITATETNFGSGDVDVIYLGTRDLYRQIKPSTSWTLLGDVYGSNPRFHTDQHDMVIRPGFPNQGIIANDGGMYRLTFNPSGGSTGYTDLNNDINVFQFYGAAYHPSDKWEMLGGAQDNGTFHQNGRLDTPGIVRGGDGTYPIIKANSPNTQLAGTQYLSQGDDGKFQLRRTDDGWETSYTTADGIGVPNEMPFVPYMVADPTNPDYVYACGKGVYRYRFSTNTWSVRLGNFDFGSTVYAFAVAPTNGDRMYVGTAGGKIFTTSNGGSTWTEVTATAPLPANVIPAAISVSPSSSTSFVVVSSDYHSAGQASVLECSNVVFPSWTDRTGNLPDAPMSDLERDPEDPVNTWFAATDAGVFRTTNRGASWSSFATLPDVVVTDLQYIPGQRFLYAATFGRGIWRYGYTDDLEPQSFSSYARSTTGSLSSLLTTDLQSVVVRPYIKPFSTPKNDRQAWVDINLSSPVADPSKFTVNFSAQQSSPHFRTSIQILNYDTGKYEEIWATRSSFLFSNRTAVLDGGDSLTPYVSVLRNIRLRFKIEANGPKATDTSLAIDRVWLRTEP